MRRAFTLIELFVVISIIATLTLISVPCFLQTQHFINVGESVQIKASHTKAVVVEYRGSSFLCRVDGGPDAHPRYTEIHFFREELEPLTEPEK